MRTRILTWDIILAAVSWSPHKKVSAPTRSPYKPGIDKIILFYFSKKTSSQSLVVASATAEQEVLGSILGPGSVVGLCHQEFLSNSHGVWICARWMAIYIFMAPYYMGLKNITGEKWVYH